MIDHIIPAAIVSASVVGQTGAAIVPTAASFARTAGSAMMATVRSPQMLGTLAGTGALYLGATVAVGAIALGGYQIITKGPSVARRTASFAARQFKKLRAANDLAEAIEPASAPFAAAPPVKDVLGAAAAA